MIDNLVNPPTDEDTEVMTIEVFKQQGYEDF